MEEEAASSNTGAAATLPHATAAAADAAAAPAPDAATQPADESQAAIDSDAHNASIFVSLVSYRDPDTPATVASLFSRASNPARVRVGIVWQLHEAEDAEWMREWEVQRASYHAESVRELRLPHTEAAGPCYARSLAQQRLFRDERFYLQLDSHMRLAHGWDSELVREWHSCRHSRAVLTAYPPGFDDELEQSSAGSNADADVGAEADTEADSGADPNAAAQEQGKPGKEVAAQRKGASEHDPSPFHSSFSSSSRPPLLCASHFDARDGMLRIVGRAIDEDKLQGLAAASATSAADDTSSSTAVPSDPNSPLPCLFYAAGFAFSLGSIVRAVPYDPSLRMLFFGEETSYLARLYTSGWATFCPRATLVWHRWSRSYRPSFRAEVGSTPKARREESLARRRVCALLGMEPSQADAQLGELSAEEEALLHPSPPFALGSVHSLAELEQHLGVSFSRRSVSDRARNGGIDARCFRQPLHSASASASVSASSSSPQQSGGLDLSALRRLPRSQLDLVMRLVQQHATGANK